MRGAWLPAVVLGWVGLAMPAMADDPYAVLRTSGLLGTWSQDCSTEAMTGSMTLVRFTMTSLGAPLVTVGGPDFIMYSAMIEAAAPVAGGQISLTVDGGLSGAPAQVMLRMQAGALQIMQAGVWGSPLRRCISE